MPDYVTVGQVSKFTPEEIRGFLVKGRDVAVVDIGGELYAFDNLCTHEGVSFSSDSGLAIPGAVVCLLHGSTFDLGTGEVTGGPAKEPLRIYKVRVEGDDVQVALD